MSEQPMSDEAREVHVREVLIEKLEALRTARQDLTREVTFAEERAARTRTKIARGDRQIEALEAEIEARTGAS